MLGRLALVVASVLFTLAALEIGCRLWRGPEALLDWSNIVLEDRRATRAAGAGRLQYDPELGFVPTQVYRPTPAPAGLALAEPPILIVGDSYAHGDEVSDEETWAALLKPLTHRRTVNAGVSGYGLDQIVLRAERVAHELKPASIVLVFIAEDLRRSEMKRVWGAEKPYFEPGSGAPVLRNVPVPPAPEPASTLDLAQRLFGWSVLVDTVLKHKGWQYEWAIDHERVLPRGEGEKLACPLLARLSGLGVPTLVVASYDPYVWVDTVYAREQRRLSAVVLDCARQAGFGTLDLFEATDLAVSKLGPAAVFRSSHPGPIGHRITAERIAAALTGLHIPPSR
ncbi:MAG: SGNH/GDSL hydrolase family protein [bacterium]|nr:SGNH/GDSL hydrolase family protein [bacterium]